MNMQDWIKYWGTAIRHGVRPTKELLIDFLIILAVFVYNDFNTYRKTQSRVMADLISANTLASTIWPTLVAIVIVLLFRIFVIAPYRIDKELRTSAITLTKRVSVLEEEKLPKLQMVRNGIGHPWRQEQPSAIPTNKNGYSVMENGMLYTYRIGLINSGLSTGLGVRVRLEEITNRPANLLAIPCQLLFMNHEQKDISQTTDPFLVDVFCFFLGDEGARQMWICHAIQTANKDVQVGNYELRLSVGSTNGGMYFSQWWSITQTDSLPNFSFLRLGA
jgi:hypothetical protein